jgi:uroporphyrinogen-III decarboxylase
VLRACGFEPPDRIPRFDSFWDLSPAWEKQLGPRASLSDIAIWCPREGTYPTRARPVERRGGWTMRVDDWGRTVRSREGAYFDEVLSVPVPVGTDPASVVFDSPALDLRYDLYAEATPIRLARDKADYCVFGKTGGPYLRTSFVRGTEQFLIDVASDPPLAQALVDRMADHLTAVAVEQLRRWQLADTGVWIYDDMAHNGGPLVSPAAFERVLLPAYRRMIQAYKEAGARFVILHSDGNILPILDMLVDAGIDGLNPLERRAGMVAEDLRRRYPRLILTGGMCNTRTLPFGSVAEVEHEARTLIDLGREGGFVIGTHSVGPEVPLASFAAYQRACERYGSFETSAAA